MGEVGSRPFLHIVWKSLLFFSCESSKDTVDKSQNDLKHLVPAEVGFSDR